MQLLLMRKPRAGNAGLPEKMHAADGGDTLLADRQHLAKCSGTVTAVAGQAVSP
jgi:hypothetical protein